MRSSAMMRNMISKFSLDSALKKINEIANSETSITVENFINLLSGRGKALLLILLALPFCQPLQLPGFSTPFGLIIALLGFRIGLGQKIWLPHFLKVKEIPPHALSRIANISLKFINAIKKVIHPRLTWLTQNSIFLFLNGMTISLLGIILALPLPIPLTNILSAIPIVLFGLGLLEDDGLFIILAYTFILLTIISFILIYFVIKY